MKKMAVFISIFIMAILLFSAIFLFIQNQTLKQEVSILNNKILDLEKSKPTPTPVLTLTSTPTKILTDKIPEGWKEYRDEEYKFRIWYPEKFTYDNITDQTQIEKYKIKDGYVIDFSVNVLSDSPLRLLYVYVYDKYTSGTMEDFIVEETRGNTKNIKNVKTYITKEKINNIDFYKLDINKYFVRYYTEKDSKIYILYYNGELLTISSDTLKIIFDQMVQSFKFIE